MDTVKDKASDSGKIMEPVKYKVSDSGKNMDTVKYKASDSGKTTDPVNYKIFNDSVHGHIKMPLLLVKIIDTPEFQRLRYIKQLGASYYVFPTASHNRFEHSIGMAHLAGKFVQTLKAQGNDIDEKDELCVQIAGLCHDLGHGPFSHVFEVFMKKKYPKWKYEEASIRMFEHLITKKTTKNAETIKEHMKKDYGFKDEDFEFIKELIYHPEAENPAGQKDTWTYKGRGEDKSYLYEIVDNKRTGIDVGKMDYLARDCLHLGMKSNFSHERFMKFARVCTNENDKKQICMRDKEALNMYELFHVRYVLHHNAYQHKVTKAIEMMIIDVLLAAETYFQLGGKKISDIALSDTELYLKLTDYILLQIKESSPPDPNPSSNSDPDPDPDPKTIEERELYTCIGTKIFKPEELEESIIEGNQEELVTAWLHGLHKSECLQSQNHSTDCTHLSERDFIVWCVKLNYGMENDNPIDFLRFYRKNNKDKGIKLPASEIPYIQPEIFNEIKVMLFYKRAVPACLLCQENITKFWKIIRKFI